LDLCEGVSQTGAYNHSKVLGNLLNYIYARRENWIGFDNSLDDRVHAYFNTERKSKNVEVLKTIQADSKTNIPNNIEQSNGLTQIEDNWD